MKKELQPQNHLNNNFYVMPSIASQMMTTRQVQETLLDTNNFVSSGGRGYRLKVKNVGAGMKQVSLVPFDE